MKLCIYSDVSNDLIALALSLFHLRYQVYGVPFMIQFFHPDTFHLFAPNWTVYLLFRLAIPL